MLFGKKKDDMPEPFKLPHLGEPKPLMPLMDEIKADVKRPSGSSSPMRRDISFPRPEPLMQPRAGVENLPTIKNIKHPEPHLFIKVDKYTDVRTHVNRMSDRLKDLTATLEKMEHLKEEEIKRIELLRGTRNKMQEIVDDLEKTFKEAREEYE